MMRLWFLMAAMVANAVPCSAQGPAAQKAELERLGWAVKLKVAALSIAEATHKHALAKVAASEAELPSARDEETITRQLFELTRKWAGHGGRAEELLQNEYQHNRSIAKVTGIESAVKVGKALAELEASKVALARVELEVAEAALKAAAKGEK